MNLLPSQPVKKVHETTGLMLRAETEIAAYLMQCMMKPYVLIYLYVFVDISIISST
jgi:hypothetical protein